MADLDAIACDPAGFADAQMRTLRAIVETLLGLLAALELVARAGVPNAAGERAAAGIVAGFEQLERWSATELPRLVQRARAALDRIRSVS